jgi:hypothetical protein
MGNVQQKSLASLVSSKLVAGIIVSVFCELLVPADATVAIVIIALVCVAMLVWDIKHYRRRTHR